VGHERRKAVIREEAHFANDCNNICRPVIGGFITNRKGWRWTQWTMLMFAAFTMVLTFFSRETFHPAIKRQQFKELGLDYASTLSTSVKLKKPTSNTIFRPIKMLLFEPIVSFVSLYVACAFATLFTFFAATPFVFQGIYGFALEDSGLVFLSVVVGCLFGTVTVVLCDIFLYRRQSASYRGRQVPPELRLYPSLIGSIGLPVGLFWFGWTSRPDISWASPLVAMMVFAWGNLCVFLSTAQYIVDAYDGLTVASAMSTNSLARYGLAAAFPLFTIPSESIHYVRQIRATNCLNSVYKSWCWLGLHFTRIHCCGIVTYSLDTLHHGWKHQSHEQITNCYTLDKSDERIPRLGTYCMY
jgi:MFS family permease